MATDNNKHKQAAELNRNYCFLTGQIFFLTVVGTRETVSYEFCVFVAFVTLVVWLAVFSWTALSGYLLYEAIIKVFDTGNDKLWPLYIVGYGVPLIIAASTLIAGIVQSAADANALVRFDACWLNEPYVLGFVIPVGCVVLFNSIILAVSLKTITQVNSIFFLSENDFSRTGRH